MSEGSTGAGLMSTRWRVAFAVVAVLLAWAVLIWLGTMASVDLVVVLLPLLLVTFGIGAVSGAVAGMLSALVLVLLVNWYVVPPVHTLSIASAESQVALAVFVVAAVVASLLTTRIIHARAQASTTLAERRLISDVVEELSATDALTRLRLALNLDLAVLTRASAAAAAQGLVWSPAPTSMPESAAVIDVVVLDDYRLRGYGPARIAGDPAFVESLAAAVARAYESQLLLAEQANAERLRDRDRSRSALLASVGHDLRTPLSSIRIASEALISTRVALDASERRELLATIGDSSRRLDELITNLLDMSRIEAGAVISQPEACDAEAAVDEAIAELGTDLVTLGRPQAPVSINADPALLARVLVNLLSNALRHQGAPGPIEVQCERSGAQAVIAVVDHGRGIDPAQLEASLEPFAQIGSRADGGSGAGLFIAREFCAAMGGSLHLDQTSGGGLTATVVLPASPQ